MTDIKSMLLSELQEDFALRGLQKFRAAQVYRWLHQRGATSFDEMTDLSKDLRVALKESFEIRNTEIAIRRVSKIDGTKKYLFRLNDGEMIESVLMKYINTATPFAFPHRWAAKWAARSVPRAKAAFRAIFCRVR